MCLEAISLETIVTAGRKFSEAEVIELADRLLSILTYLTEPPLDRRFPSARLAHTALTSTDGSYGDLLHLRPADSQVELYRNCDRLEINLPQISTRYTEENFISNSLFNLFILACFFSLGSFLGLSLGWSVISWSLKIYYLIFLALPLVLWNIRQKYLERQTYIGYRVLSIDKASKNFKIGIYSKSTKEFRWTTMFSQNPKIDLLIYHPSYSFDNYFDEESSQKKSGLVTTSAKLSIHMGKHEYNFTENNLSEAELHWLGKELSDFLDLELQVICHTPNIPAPPSEDPFGCGCC